VTILTKKKSVRGHPNGSLLNRMIEPKSIMQSQRPVFPIRSNHFFEYRLNLMIRNLNLTTSLRVIKGSYFVSHKILSKQILKRSMTKMTTSITNKRSRGTISTENAHFHKVDYNVVFIGPGSLSFPLLRHIINNDRYAYKAKRGGKGAY